MSSDFFTSGPLPKEVWEKYSKDAEEYNERESPAIQTLPAYYQCLKDIDAAIAEQPALLQKEIVLALQEILKDATTGKYLLTLKS